MGDIPTIIVIYRVLHAEDSDVRFCTLKHCVSSPSHSNFIFQVLHIPYQVLGPSKLSCESCAFNNQVSSSLKLKMVFHGNH